MPTINLELDVEYAQEIASTLRTTINKIDWVLENTPPKKFQARVALDARAKLLSRAATQIEYALHARALTNVVNIVANK